MVRLQWRFVAVGLLCAVFSANAPAAEGGILEEMFSSNGFTIEQDRFRGDFETSDSWRGKLCDGSYKFKGLLAGRVAKLKMDLTEEGTVDVSAELDQISGNVSGNYRSDATLCVPLSKTLKAEVDWFTAEAKVWLIPEGEEGAFRLKVRIQKTALGQIHFPSGLVPNWLEQLLTRLVDKGLNVVWKTQLGDWIGDKVGEYLKEKFPGGGKLSVE